ncbi:MAG: sulfurtransferase [Gemmatimonadales bacterium]
MRAFVRRTAAAAACVLVASSALPAQGTGPAALLISPQDLKSHLEDKSLVLLYVGPKDGYEKEHIPGARYVDFSTDLAVSDSARHMDLELPDEADLRARLERLGIGDRSKIVVTPGEDWGSPSTRVVWSLQAAGLGANTRLLNGGTLGWKAAGFPLTNVAPPAPAPGHLTVRADRSVVVDYKWIQAHADAPHVRIIDARSPVFYEGPGNPQRRVAAGHIAGARNIPFDGLFDDSVHVFAIAELRKKFDAAGVAPGDTVAAYCHVGQQATMVVFAARLLGHPAVLYDGSMSDWKWRKLPLEGGTDTAAKRP